MRLHWLIPARAGAVVLVAVLAVLAMKTETAVPWLGWTLGRGFIAAFVLLAALLVASAKGDGR